MVIILNLMDSILKASLDIIALREITRWKLSIYLKVLTFSEKHPRLYAFFISRIATRKSVFKEVLGFPQAFTSYADDRFGLRRMFLHLGSRLRWILGLKISPTVLFGKNGWLYLGLHDNVIEQFRGIDVFSRDELVSWVQRMVSRRDWLRERGIPFILVVAPNKHTIYPEYLPIRVGNVLGKTPLDQLAEYIAAHTDLDFVDLREPLMAAKKEHRVFYKTDSHWNNMGGFVGYEEIMKHVRGYFPDVKSLTLNDFSIVEGMMYDGGLTQMINLKGKIGETWPFFSPKFSSHILSDKETGEKGTSERVDIETDLDDMPKALIFADSFMIAMRPYFAETFHRVVIVPHKGLTFDPALIEKEKPDIVIYEVVERLLRNEIHDDRTVLNKISQPVLDEIVGSAGTQMKNIRFGDGFVLLGARLLDSKNGKTVQLVWKSLKKQPLSYSVAIHLINKQGNTLHYFDYLQNNGQTVVNPGDTWLDEVRIPGSIYERCINHRHWNLFKKGWQG